MCRIATLLVLSCSSSLLGTATAFTFPAVVGSPQITALDDKTTTRMNVASATSTSSSKPEDLSCLVQPEQRDERYGKNVAQYLVDLHDNRATFDFCGGMMFQLVLTEKLRTHLVGVASSDSSSEGAQNQPIIFDGSKTRMFRIPDYAQSAEADDVRIFHGREIRKVPDAVGGMGFVLQLSMAGDVDPEGWTSEERSGYDGWGHDGGRVWRHGKRYEDEGFATFRERFGPNAFGLHHRFYLHLDGANRMWLSAEDGCEGTPALTKAQGFSLSNLFGLV